MGLVDVALRKLKTVAAVGEDVESVTGAGLVERALERRDHVGRHMLVGFGKAEIHLTFDPIDEQMWRVLGVGDNADPVERRRSGEAIGKPRRDSGHVPPTYTIADAADPARPHLILRVEKPEPRGSLEF